MPNNVDSVIANEALQQTSAPPRSPRLFIYFSAPLQLAAKRLVIKSACQVFEPPTFWVTARERANRLRHREF